jgi:peptidoglycan/LPS O-acetylase OafA/YrhL
MAHTYGRALALDWRAHWLKFAIARFARLYPLFVATTLVMIVVVALSHTHTPMEISLSRRSLALQPFLLQQWASSLSWNYPSWSISTETEAYVYFIFFVGLLITGRHPGFIAAGCIFILVSLSVFNGGQLKYIVGLPALLRTLSEFSLGALLYRVHSRPTEFPLRWVALSVIVLASLGMATHFDFLVVGAFVCFIYYCINTKDALSSLLNSRPYGRSR